MLSTIFLFLRFVAATPECPAGDAWVQGDGRQTQQERRETRRRMRRTWRAMGLDRESVEVLDSIVVRESHGDMCAVHILGKNEYGLGPGGLQVRLHLHRWDPEADPRVLHVPEVSAVVMARLLRKFKRAYRAKTWLRIGQLYGGRMRYPDIGMDELWCERLERRGIDCKSPVGDLGTRLGDAPQDGQDMFVFQLRAKHMVETRKKRR